MEDLIRIVNNMKEKLRSKDLKAKQNLMNILHMDEIKISNHKDKQQKTVGHQILDLNEEINK